MAPKKPASAKSAAPAAEPGPPADQPPPDPGPETDRRRLRFRAAFHIYDPEDTGDTVMENVPTILRYLGIFVPESEWTGVLAPALQEGAPAPYVSRARLEAKVVELMDAHAYEPDGPEALFAAFRALDKANQGFVDLPAFRDALQNRGGPGPDGAMSAEEADAFCRALAPRAFRPRAAAEKKGGGKDDDDEDEEERRESERIYYADYIAMMTRF